LTPAIERFLVKISVSSINFYNNTPCWEWIAYRNNDGYGNLQIKNRPIGAHRFIFEYYHGSICPDLTIDHLCRNRACVNPAHLEQVTNKENILRGQGLCAINARKTHCNHGHEFTPENTYFDKNNGRYCRICMSKRMKEYRNTPKGIETKRKYGKKYSKLNRNKILENQRKRRSLNS